ncbi:galanin receptor 2a-like [Watersipora subatra]|uniref:galanin receptor 2a-like n=1 Tax=Watersipora subatra TaxID=2589382 RepID=UPI00355B5F80
MDEGNATTKDLDEVYWNNVHSDSRYKASTIIGKYVLFTLFVFGSIGNLLSFAVMVRRPMRSSSTAFYMASLALVDTTVMFIGCLRRWVVEVFQVDLLNYSPEACKAVNFFQYWSFDVAVWTLVAMTVHRAAVVIASLKAYKHATRGRAAGVLAVVAVICAGINMHFFFTTTYVGQICTGDQEYRYFYEFIWPWVDATVYSFLPFTLLLVMNIIIIVSLSKANARKRKMTNNFQQRKKSEQRQGTISQKLTIMLLSATSTFLLLTAPAVILDILRGQGAPYFDLSQTNDMALYILCRQIARVLLYINHSIKFFLYCILGNRFRKQLFVMLGCKCNSIAD